MTMTKILTASQKRKRKRQPRVKRKRSYRRAGRAYTYLALIAERYANGLLTPFWCAACGIAALDPGGRNGKGEWLCLDCADGEEAA
jgi:hypothetical protein